MNLINNIKTGTLIGRYLTGKENKDDADVLGSWLREDPGHQELFDSIKDEKELALAVKTLDSYNQSQAWRNYLVRITAMNLRRDLLRWKVAAVFFFVVGCAGILAFFNTHPEPVAGSNSPDLYTRVFTGSGQHSKVILPDSSVVWLDAQTTLSYNTGFAVNGRDIKLTGQAFFEIAPDEKMPLYVHVNDFKVKVRGTKFDVSAFPEDGRIDVILESGSVELLDDADRSFSQMLNPGERASFDPATRKMNISQVNVYRYTSWKDGMLIFENAPMEEVLEKLERWYDIQIEVKDPRIYSLLFNATIINEDVDEIFDLIAYTCAVNYRILSSKKPGVPVKVILTKY